jgi:glutamine cyclotransferase
MKRALVLVALLVVLAPLRGQTGTPVPTYGYQLVKTYPHDSKSFTQGLIFLDGTLYESTGMQGASKLRRVQLDTGKVLQEFVVTPEYFAEGMTNWGPDLIQLTWTTGTAFVYDRATFKLKKSFQYAGEGWGLTQDGTRLILSDGSSTIKFMNPQTFQETGRITVKDRGKPIDQINELEVVKGEIWANIWHSDRIARISPKTGDVVGWIDLTGIGSTAGAGVEAVLNGIAYDAATDRILVTGKYWSKVFEIKVVPKTR